MPKLFLSLPLHLLPMGFIPVPICCLRFIGVHRILNMLVANGAFGPLPSHIMDVSRPVKAQN
jgi:hypothetical protein